MRNGHWETMYRWVEDNVKDNPPIARIVFSIVMLIIGLYIIQYIIQNIMAIIIIGLIAIVLFFATYPWKLRNK